MALSGPVAPGGGRLPHCPCSPRAEDPASPPDPPLRPTWPRGLLLARSLPPPGPTVPSGLHPRVHRSRVADTAGLRGADPSPSGTGQRAAGLRTPGGLPAHRQLPSSPWRPVWSPGYKHPTVELNGGRTALEIRQTPQNCWLSLVDSVCVTFPSAKKNAKRKKAHTVGYFLPGFYLRPLLQNAPQPRARVSRARGPRSVATSQPQRQLLVSTPLPSASAKNCSGLASPCPAPQVAAHAVPRTSEHAQNLTASRGVTSCPNDSKVPPRSPGVHPTSVGRGLSPRAATRPRVHRVTGEPVPHPWLWTHRPPCFPFRPGPPAFRGSRLPSSVDNSGNSGTGAPFPYPPFPTSRPGGTLTTPSPYPRTTP